MPRSQSFRQPVARKPRVDRAQMPHYWHPDRVGAVQAPAWFMAQIRALDGGEDLDVRWSPVHQRWLVWERKPRIQNPICPGWRLLFIHHDVDQSYLPLDNRLIARLYAASARAHGNAKQYFERVVAEMARDKAKAEATRIDEQVQAAMPFYDHAQIQVSMRGPSSGSKFSTYHAGG